MIIEDRYHHWTVMDKTPVRKKGRMFIRCYCKCGLEKEVYWNSLRTGDSRQCKRCSSKSNPLPKGFKEQWSGDQQPFTNRQFEYIRRKAAERGIPFLLDKTYLWELLVSQNFRCAISGSKIELVRDRIGKVRTTSASVDRIDSSKPYRPFNVQWVHKRINRMKGDLSDTHFISLCKTVVKYQESKDTGNIHSRVPGATVQTPVFSRLF